DDAIAKAQNLLNRPAQDVGGLVVHAVLRRLGEFGVSYPRQLDILTDYARDIGDRMGGDATALLSGLAGHGSKPDDVLSRFQDRIQVVAGQNQDYPLSIEILDAEGKVAQHYSAQGAIAALEVWLSRSLERSGGLGWRVSDQRGVISNFDARDGLRGWTIPSPTENDPTRILKTRAPQERKGSARKEPVLVNGAARDDAAMKAAREVSTREVSTRRSKLPVSPPKLGIKKGRKEPVFEGLKTEPAVRETTPTPTYHKIERQRGPAALLPRTVSTQVFIDKIHADGFRSMVQYWDSLRAGRRMPSRAEIHPGSIPFAVHDLALISVSANVASRFRFRLVGTDLARIIGSNAVGKVMTEMGAPSFAQHSVTMLETAMSARGPVFSSESWRKRSVDLLPDESQESDDGGPMLLERLVLPLANDGRDINTMLMCVRLDNTEGDGTPSAFERAMNSGETPDLAALDLDAAAIFLRD
ncbi:MAG: PAS domain-containing protein, partial [Pseudomonadota bacterium]